MRASSKTQSDISKRLRPFVCVVFLSALCAFGQNVNGTIVGTVSDSTSASIPAATVTITDVDTNVSHSAQTDASGYYSVPDLPPGTYKVTAQKEGFSTAINTGLSLFADRTVRADMILNPGAVTQTVSVSSAVMPELQTDTADTGRDIGTTEVAELPLGDGRNFQGLLTTVPGAGVTVKDHSTFYNQQLSEATTINGQSSMYNTFDIEGVSDNQRSQLLQIYIPPIEAIQEVQITTSNYDPQQGTALGAVTNVILKSGGNQFHGEGYYFYQGDALSAKSYFQTTPKNHAVYNYFGGNIGGPIQKGKMFFFVSFLEYRQHLGEFYQGQCAYGGDSDRRLQRSCANADLRSHHRRYRRLSTRRQRQAMRHWPHPVQLQRRPQCDPSQPPGSDRAGIAVARYDAELQSECVRRAQVPK